ncbi:NAD-dependent epimerase/dehydratase family protein, partial [Dactylosporangium sp. NPDC051541]|uniref:NAD-dependent epimerase/dehydratase family protein n=1 Tax=Dactylosporangium sp. NPDC051541 TaxID=3363977 RepID=UPI0037A07264
MTTPIVLTGGTGTLGRLLLPHLLEAGRPIRVLTRRRPAHHSPADPEFADRALAERSSAHRGSAHGA